MHIGVLNRPGSLVHLCRLLSRSPLARARLPALPLLTTSKLCPHLAMFHRAVDAHAQATPADLSKQLFPSSSPIAQFTATSQTQRNAPHARGVPTQNTLRPSQGNALNTNGLTKRPISSVPVKRTSNGLAKVFGGSSGFNDKPQYSGSQVNPVLIEDGNSKVQFDENDFDSDLDLDIEDPSVKGGVHYPTPPPARSAHIPKAKYSPVQKANLSTYANVDSGYKPEPPPSSIPMPWSSSPVSHTMPPPATNKFSGYAYTAANVNRSQAARPTPVSIKPEQKTSPAPAPQAKAVDPRAPKRRTLPWLQESAQAMPVVIDEPPPLRPSTSHDDKRSVSVKPEMTPRGKMSEQSAYPWNTTASAVKEQQKLLRKANQKKLVKENEATVESKAAAIAVKRSQTVARPHLSQEQRQVLKLVVDDGKSVFFTGSAGTGKSVLLREIIAVLRKKHSRESDRVAMTASTGLAACNIGGVTLHSFAGIGLGKESVDELIKKIKRNQKAKHRWMRTKVLIVDEVSMVDGELFDKLEEIGRRLRNNGRPFGGIQLVITGDFFQLPPVPERGREARFAFDARTWDSAISHTIGLKHVFRQKDPVFAEMLNEMREGRLSQKSIAAFRKLDRPLHFEDDLAATELFPTRGEVENANTMRMKQLSGEIRNFDARDGGSIVDPNAREKLLQNCMAPQKLELKKGSQVMLIKNIDEMLVNGSLGKVIGFMDEEKFNSYSADPELFEQARESDDEDTKKKKQKIKQSSLLSTTSQSWPLVRFAIADGTTRDLLCQRELWKVELPNGEVQASRAQVPLILAWALSIHKAQGQTLERVKVDLGKVFEKGQAYVALSRATNMAGLQVSRFDPNKVLAHDKVRTFYAGLSAVEQAGQEDVKMKSAPKPKVKDDDYDY